MTALSLLFIFFSSNHIPAEPLSQDNPDETQEENEIEIEEPKNLYALSACLMDADSGRILFGKEEDVRRANASTTKIMTLIVTLEHADLNNVVTFSDYAASQPDVQLNGASGEQFLLKDLCFSLMLESHNDSAVAIAEHVAGSVEAFAGLMNKKAAELGCMDTYFITPNGLDKEDAEDYAAGEMEELATVSTAALGKLKVESADLQPKEIMVDWVEYIKMQCIEKEEVARCVRKKGKTLKGCIAELLKWSFKNAYSIPDDISKAAGIKGANVELGIPGMGQAKKIINDYYMS